MENREQLQAWEFFSVDDRKRLHNLIEEAAKKVFPFGRKFGTPQMTFYFRKLLQELLKNAGEHGVPATGGSHGDLFRFAYELHPAYVDTLAAEERKRRHKRIAEDSMVSVTSHWKAAFESVEMRSKGAPDGDVLFYFQQGTVVEGGAVILGAKVSRFRVDGDDARLDIPTFTRLSETEDSSAGVALPDVARLPPIEELRVPDEDIDEKRAALSREARKYLKKSAPAVMEAFERGLARMPIQELESHVADLRKGSRQRLVRLIWSALTSIVAIGAIAFVLFKITRSTALSVSVISHQGHVDIPSIRSNEDCKIAYFNVDTNQRLTDWSDRLVNPTSGEWIEAKGCDPRTGKFNVTIHNPRGVTSEFYIPPEWRTDEATVRTPQVAFSSFNPDRARQVILWTLVDTRIWPKSMVPDDVNHFWIDFGFPGGIAQPELWNLNPSGTRYALFAQQVYPRDGDYTIVLKYQTKFDSLVSADPTMKQFTYSRPIFATKPLIRVRVRTGHDPELVAVGKDAQQTEGLKISPGVLQDGSIPSQIIVDRVGSDNAHIFVGFIPDRQAWPSFERLDEAIFGIMLDDTLWFPGGSSELSQHRFPAGAGSYCLGRGFKLTPGSHTMELVGKYQGKELATMRVTIEANPTTLPSVVGVDPKRVHRQAGDSTLYVNLAR